MEKAGFARFPAYNQSIAFRATCQPHSDQSRAIFENFRKLQTDSENLVFARQMAGTANALVFIKTTATPPKSQADESLLPRIQKAA